MYEMFFFTQYSHRETARARDSAKTYYRTHSRTPHILNNIELN